MKLLHQLGHNFKWSLDSYFLNEIGDGFIYTSYNIQRDKIGKQLSGHKFEDILTISMIDLQFFGNRKSKTSKLKTYPFHPINAGEDYRTQEDGFDLIEKGIHFQEEIGFNNIIIPFFYRESSEFDKMLDDIRVLNNRLFGSEKKKDFKYFLSIPISNDLILNENSVEKLLIALTDIKIDFDGFYIVCDYKAGYKQKVSINYDYYTNLIKVFRTLNKHGFETIYGYSNWDSLIMHTLSNIDYISIGTYETLRKFNIERYTQDGGGGPSDGWYFSEKLLNFIKAQEINRFRKNNAIELIKNSENIFSDIILEPGFVWNIHKGDIHKNYLLSISRLHNELASFKDINERCKFMADKITSAKNLYRKLYEEYGIHLHDENEDYHLSTWQAILEDNMY